MSDPAAEFRAWLVKAEEDRLCIRNELNAAQKPWGDHLFSLPAGGGKVFEVFPRVAWREAGTDA
jgi:hypothetical protein